MAKRKGCAENTGLKTRSGTGTEINSRPDKKTDAERMLLEKLKRSFDKAKEEIAKTIVTTEAPSTDLDITDFYSLSTSVVPDYVTLDWQHCAEIMELMGEISDYARDQSRKRPLNIMMQAEPGAGKSHFIKCLTRAMSQYNIQEVSFNMTAVECMEDLTKPLDAVRNVKVNDRLPLLFLDEFDCAQKNFPLLLPLLWDGELQVGHRELKVGRVVIILASSAKNTIEVMESTQKMPEKIKEGTDKLVDLLSRINGGVLTIPGLDDVTRDRDRRVDKVCLAIALLRDRFGDKLERAPWSLLSFISQSVFRYGARSIAHLVDLIPQSDFKEGVLETSRLNFILSDVSTLKGSSLAYHLIGKPGPGTVIKLWRELKQQKVSVRFRRGTPGFQWEALQRFLWEATRRR